MHQMAHSHILEDKNHHSATFLMLPKDITLLTITCVCNTDLHLKFQKCQRL